MCGRFTQHAEAATTAALLARIGSFSSPGACAVPPRYNIAPTQRSLVATARPQQDKAGPLALDAEAMAFGFQPSYLSHSVVNARRETVSDKPLFRRALATKRCLVVATGFYEWATLPGKKKQPYFFSRTDGEPFVFAGLFREVQANDKAHTQVRAEFVIVTTVANACVEPIHPRMPVMLDDQAASLWLDAQSPLPLVVDLLQPFDARQMRRRAVSPEVNRPQKDAPDCLDAILDPQAS